MGALNSDTKSAVDDVTADRLTSSLPIPSLVDNLTSAPQKNLVHPVTPGTPGNASMILRKK
jgi:hypothetical protein